MRSFTLSALDLIRTTLRAANEALPPYSCRKSPHKFTQSQLIAILAFKDFLKQTYRGVVQILTEWSDVRTALALKSVPDYSTLAKAEKRLLRKKRWETLMDAAVSEARRSGMVEERCRQAALDSTGYENGHTSIYYGQRTGVKKRHFPKVTALMDTRSHFYLSGVMNQGPHSDQREFREAVRTAYARVPFDELLADAAYDSEPNHVLLRETMGVRSIMPALIGRPTDKAPRGRYRRQLARRFPRKRYGQRWQSESGFSQDKRRFGSSIEGRSYWARCRKLNLRFLLHDVALLLCALFASLRSPMSLFTRNNMFSTEQADPLFGIT